MYCVQLLDLRFNKYLFKKLNLVCEMANQVDWQIFNVRMWQRICTYNNGVLASIRCPCDTFEKPIVPGFNINSICRTGCSVGVTSGGDTVSFQNLLYHVGYVTWFRIETWNCASLNNKVKFCDPWPNSPKLHSFRKADTIFHPSYVIYFQL